MKINHTARLETTIGSPVLRASEVREFIAQLPDDAEINAIMRDRGSQRDPEPYLYGLTARWET